MSNTTGELADIVVSTFGWADYLILCAMLVGSAGIGGMT